MRRLYQRRTALGGAANFVATQAMPRRVYSPASTRRQVTDLWGVGHGYGGHGFAGTIVACNVETRGLFSWVSSFVCIAPARVFWLGLHLWCADILAPVVRRMPRLACFGSAGHVCVDLGGYLCRFLRSSVARERRIAINSIVVAFLLVQLDCPSKRIFIQFDSQSHPSRNRHVPVFELERATHDHVVRIPP